MCDLAILNGTVVSDGQRSRRDVAIEGSTIAAVAAPGTLGSARRVIDAEGSFVLPGAIDVHFHCRAPSHPERGDFSSETRAAIAGGVTTVFEMPISDPACSTPEVLRAREALAARESYAHFALYAGGGRDSATVQALAEAGAIGFKIFTTTPPAHRRREFEGLCAVREDEIHAALSGIVATNLPCVFHAENQPLIEYFGTRLTRFGVPARPPVVEAAQIAVIGAIAADLGARVHIAHLTSAAGLAVFRAVRTLGAAITAETCPQYLLFDDRAVSRWGAFVKIGPPLREEADVAALWEGLLDRTIALVSSDHSPFRPEEKSGVPYSEAPQGMPSVELLLPVLLDAAFQGRLSLEQAVDLVTAAPARIFGLAGRKGTIAEGADADLVIVEPDTRSEVRVDQLFTRAAGCAVAYDGMVLQGRISRTLVDGQIAFEHGAIVGPPRGRFVRPALVGAVGQRA